MEVVMRMLRIEAVNKEIEKDVERVYEPSLCQTSRELIGETAMKPWHKSFQI